MSKSNGKKQEGTGSGGGGVNEAEEKGKASRRCGVGSREIRDKRKNKTKIDAMERKITSVYRDINKMPQQRAVMWRQK